MRKFKFITAILRRPENIEQEREWFHGSETTEEKIKTLELAILLLEDGNRWVKEAWRADGEEYYGKPGACAKSHQFEPDDPEPINACYCVEGAVDEAEFLLGYSEKREDDSTHAARHVSLHDYVTQNVEYIEIITREEFDENEQSWVEVEEEDITTFDSIPEWNDAGETTWEKVEEAMLAKLRKLYEQREAELEANGEPDPTLEGNS